MKKIQKAKVKKTNETVNVRMKQVKTADAEYIMFEDVQSGEMYKFSELDFNVSNSNGMFANDILDD